MAKPTILVVGATGNTGKSVVRLLPKLLESTGKSRYRIVGLTRSLDSAASKQLASLPDVEMLEKDWTTIDAEWLKSHNVVRAYIAPHSQPDQFVEESAFHIALLRAGVEYVVRVSANVNYVKPTSPVFFGCSHWAIETLLSQPEFKGLKWTSLQPNYFTGTYLASAVEWVKAYRSTGTQGVLALIPEADTTAAIIDPEDIGNVGAHLLALDNPTPHSRARYILNGPEDVTGQQIVEVAEQLAGVKAQEVQFKSTSWLSDLVKHGALPEKLLPSFTAALDLVWQNEFSLAAIPTSEQVLEIAPPRRTVADAMKAMLDV